LPFDIEANKNKIMLNNIRKSKIGIVLAIVFGISLFLIKGGNKYSGIFGVGANDVAAVGNVNISDVQFLRAFDLTKSKFEEILNSNLTYEEAKSLNLDKQALSFLIREAIFMNEFEKLRIFLDKIIIAKISKNYVPFLYDENNNLIKENLENYLYNQNLNLEDFVNIITYQGLKEIYDNALIKNISYPNNISKIITKYNDHERKINYLIIPDNKVEILIEEDEKLIKEYYEENINLFSENEKRSIEYINLEPNNFIEMFEISNDELENYYKKNINLFTEKEKRSFIQLNFQDKETAEDYLSKFKLIEDNDEIIKILENDGINFNEYNLLNEDEILEEISSIAFNLKLNKVSKIIEGPLAYHIIIVKDILPKEITSYESSKDKILKQIQNYYSIEYIQDLIENIDNDILNNFTLNEISKKYNLNINKFIKVENRYNSKNTNDLIIQEAFNEEKNITSDIFNGINEGSYFIFSVLEIYEKKPKIYNAIKNEVIEKWKQKNVTKKLEEFSKNLLNDTDDKLLDKLSKKYSSNIIQETINLKNKNLPREFIEGLFNIDPGNYFELFKNDNIYLGYVDSIYFNENNNSINIKNDLNQTIVSELENEILNNISQNIEIITNDNLLNTLTINR
tara:strand:+ start:6346 stop:8223 length:1878 start_codon:yes stop_codon:yes gene_type:complete